MEKKKNNKKLFAIIAASALAFVLTVALSVSITLAYFGESKTATKDNAITIGTPLKFAADGAPAVAVADGEGVKMVPGDKANVTFTFKIAKNDSTDAYVRFKLAATGAVEGKLTYDTTAMKVTVGGTEVTTAKEGDYYYIVEGANVKAVTLSGADDVEVKVTGAVIKLDVSVVNADVETGGALAAANISLSAEAGIVQSKNIPAGAPATVAANFLAA